MKQRTRDLREQGDRLFSKRSNVTQMWQWIAEQLYSERADFLGGQKQYEREWGEEQVTGAPEMARRDLADALSAMLRPRESPWFHARALDERINEDSTAILFFDWLSDRMRRAMYDKRAQFIRATKQGDNDFATFGQCVIELSPNRDLTGLLYRNWHLRDVAWCENDEFKIDVVHRNWEPEARQLLRMFPGKLAANVTQAAEKEPYKKIKCRHIVVPIGDYDYTASRPLRVRDKFISIYIDVENDKVLEEVPVSRLRYVIPRWATVAGSQYAHSPGAVIAYRDARLLQQITHTLLEAGEKVVDPPSVGVQEAIQGGVNLYAGGHTWVDLEYDEKTGEALRYLPIDGKGLNWGVEREDRIVALIQKALYLDRISVPYPEGDMTATEYRGRVEEYIRRALPLFEPMEVEYNGGLCEETLELMLELKAFGAPADWPQIARGQDMRWQFESPLQAAKERGRAQAFIDTANLLKTAAELDPYTRFDVDIGEAFRDAVPGTGAPAKWIRSKEEADQMRAQQQQQDQAMQQAQAAMAQAQMVHSAGQAAESAGAGAQAMQEAQAGAGA